MHQKGNEGHPTAPVSTRCAERRVRLLYVEDNPLVRELTYELLVRADRHVCACGTAEEALQEFKRQAFDVVITDVSLPLMSGLDLARAISRIEANVHVILATGYPLSLQLERMNDHWRSIAKPFGSADIDAIIRECLESAGTAR